MSEPTLAREVSPVRLAHLVLRVRDLDRAVEWWRTVLVAEVAMRNEYIAFLTYDDEHHRLALVRDPRITEDEPDPSHPGLEHVSFTYATADDLFATYERLAGCGITPYWTIDHGPTTSLYYRDPEGAQVELQIDNFPDAESLHAWFRSGAFEANPIGVEVDVDELLARHRAGTLTLPPARGAEAPAR